MSEKIIVEKNNTQVLEISETEILVVEKDIKIIETGGGSANWGAIGGNINSQTDLINRLNTKVDKVEGKGLSTNDYTTEEKTKLSGIEANANYYVLPSNVVFDANYVHTDNNYTTPEKQNLANQSGTNTGDETQTTINNKIGYTPANDSDVVKLTGNQTIAGNKTFSSPINVQTGNSTFLQIITSSNIRVGGQNINHVYTLAGTVYHNFVNSATGTTTGTDGSSIGISSTGVLEIRQRENLNLEFYTNNSKVGDISETGVWSNNSGTWSTLSDERLKENISEINNGLDKVIALSRCVRHYTFKNQVKYATGYRTGYIAQLLRDNGFEGHTTLNNPIDEEEGVLLGWEYADESYFEDDKLKTRRVVVKEGDKILGIENNFTPYLIVGIKELTDKVNNLEERLKILESRLLL